MLGSLSLVDLLFIITIVLLVFNGLRNGFVFSLVNLLSLPIAFVVAWMFGPQLTSALSANNLPSTPIIAYLILFFGTVLVIHILATTFRGVIKGIPLIGFGDTLLGAVVGFVEAWLLWVVILLVLHNFLQNVSNLPGGIATAQFSSWQEFYNTAVTGSLFARVNSFIITTVPISLPTPK
jgi:uncharacterized membrane protein required for colicin V production